MNYYLTCEHCGHANAVNNEYLTFCEKCNKKLSNNFREWQKQNPDSFFEDYKDRVCEQKAPIEEKTEELVAKRDDGLVHWVNIAITLAIIIGSLPFILPSILGNSSFTFFMQEYSLPGRSMFYNWETVQFKSFGFQIDTPVDVDLVSDQVPPSQGNSILRMEVYASQPSDMLNLVVVNNEFQPQVPLVNLQAMTTSSVEQLQNLPGTSGFQISQREIKVDGVAGFRQDGSFIQNGEPMVFSAIGLSEDQMLWQVLMVSSGRDDSFEDVVDRVIESMTITYNRTL